MPSMKLLLSTSNIVGGGSAYRPVSSSKSNLEFVSSLKANFNDHNSAVQDLSNGHNDSAQKTSSVQPLWTKLDATTSTLEIPALDFANSALEEEREQYDITLKLFFLPGTSAKDRESQAREAVQLVLRELHMPSVDLLIVSFPGIFFDEEEDCPTKLSTRGTIEADPEALDTQITTWKVLEQLHAEGLVKRLGVAELGHDRLESFLSKVELKPGVNQINLRDCCSVPKDLLTLAKSQSIDLLVHNDCSNILPRGTVRELLGPGPEGVGILAASPQTGDKRKFDNEVQSSTGIVGEVQPLWVIKYTAVVKNRGVVENKGYFASAEVGV